jgi:NAD-dependent DNA ligase
MKRCPKGTRKNKDGECVSNSNNKTKKINIKSTNIVSVMESFKKDGINVLEKLKKKELELMLNTANLQFHSSTEDPILTDHEYDILKDFIESKYPTSKCLKNIGAEVVKQKVKLPVNMPSMDKIKPDTQVLGSWKKKYKGPYVISCKLDGISGLYHTVNDKKLYTRGNGTEGQDITYLLSNIKLPDIKDVIIRGELIIKKEIFETKYKDKFSNIRNMVAGIVNRKEITNISKDIDFVAYEVIKPVLTPSKQMEFLEINGFNTVKNKTHENITNDILSEKLVDWRTNYQYEIDGIIVSDDKIYQRSNKNPEHSFAFKMVIGDQLAETQVVDVIWNASKDGYLKPKVRLNPVNIGGVKIEYATGFNAKFIESNSIGVGSVVKIVRSGDVIPYIKEVVVKSEKPKMPDISYSWTDSHIDIILTNKDDDISVLEKQITLFFTTLNVDGLSIGNVKRLIKSGYNTLPKIIKMEIEDFEKVEGFKHKLSSKIKNSISEKIQKASLPLLMSASGSFGRGLGEKRIKPIIQKFPNILVSSESENEKISMIKTVEGIGEENSKLFVENISKFIKFLAECNLLEKIERNDEKQETLIDKSHPLYNKKIVITGFRDKELTDDLIEKYNVSISNSISKNTYCLIVKNREEDNSKVNKAKELNIRIYTLDEFKEKFY